MYLPHPKNGKVPEEKYRRTRLSVRLGARASTRRHDRQPIPSLLPVLWGMPEVWSPLSNFCRDRSNEILWDPDDRSWRPSTWCGDLAGREGYDALYGQGKSAL